MEVGGLGQGLWMQLLMCKNKMGNGGWYIPRQNYRVFGLWKSIPSVQMEFDHWIRYRVHGGNCHRLWHDEWCGQMVLCNQFPNLYLLDRRKQAVFPKNYCVLGGVVVWDSSFRRNLYDNEAANLVEFLGMLDKIYLSIGRADGRLWKLNVKGQFSVKSFYNVFSVSPERVEGCQILLESFCPITSFSLLLGGKKAYNFDY